MAAFGCRFALAFPDGAPWGAADPGAAENCATCHFDSDAVRDSAALTVSGLPEEPSAGALYELVVTFGNPGGVAAGFQMLAWIGNEPAGSFESAAADTETAGAAIRSIAPTRNSGAVSWVVQWRTPATVDESITIHIAATSANDDQSPLGDIVHFRTFGLPAP